MSCYIDKGKAEITPKGNKMETTTKLGRPAGPPAVNVRMSSDMMKNLMKIKHHVETKTEAPISMREAMDNAICYALEAIEAELLIAN